MSQIVLNRLKFSEKATPTMGLPPHCLKLSQIVLNRLKFSEKKGSARDGPTSHCLKLSQIVLNCAKST